MKDTELFDAIAHIDEDLIERCFADEAAPAAGASKSPAAVQEIKRKPMSAFGKTALAIGAAAAALILMVGLISVLHIGGKSPTPIGPGESPSPAPTETATEAPSEEPTPDNTPEPEIGRIDAKFTIPVGEGDHDVHYLRDNEGVFGPCSFAVRDDTAYILDSMNKSVLVISREKKSVYPLEWNTGCELFFVGASRTYVGGNEDRYICVYDADFKPEKKLALPNSMNCSDIYIIADEDANGIITLITDDMTFYTCDPESETWTQAERAEADCTSDIKSYKFAEKTFTIDAGEDTLTQFAKVDLDAGIIWLIVNKQYSDPGKLETHLCKYDTKGRLLAYVDLALTENVTENVLYPLCFTDNGKIWLMKCLNDSVVISSIEFPSSPDDTPEPDITPEPSSSPDPLKGLNENDYTVMRDFFELKDEDGVRNGEKCFPNYDPADPATWINTDPYRYNQVGWNKMGRVSAIILRGEDDAPTELVGTLDLNELGALETVHTWNVIFDEVKIDSSPVLAKPNGAKFSFPMVRGEARIVGGYADSIFLLSAAHVYCELTGDAGTAEKPSFKIEVTTEGEGYAGVSAWSDENYYEVHLVANPAEGRTFVGWFDADGKLVSTDENFELFGENTHNSAEGAHAEFVFTARFK